MGNETTADTEMHREYAIIAVENRRMRRALGRIAKWFGELPPVVDRDGKPSTYSCLYGSNGERDYMRSVAAAALAALDADDGKPLTPDGTQRTG